MGATQARIDEYRSIAAASISAVNAAVGTPIDHLWRIIHLLNDTNQGLNISFDGTINNLYMPAGSYAVYDMQANAEQNSVFRISLQTQIYVNAPGTLPTTGKFYVMGIYGKGE